MKTDEATAATAEVKKTLLGLAGDEKALVILKGDFKHPFLGKDLVVDGSLAAPAEFFEKNVKEAGMFDLKDCQLRTNRKDLKIVLYCGVRAEFKTEISGALRSNPDLAAFKINTEERWKVKDLVKLLKMRKFFFQDKDLCDKLTTTLMSFKAKFEATIEKSDDLKGTTVDAYATKLSHEMDLTYSLNMPIFIGTTPTLFKVEICVDASDPRDVKFWMESVGLAEAQVSVRDQYIDEQVAKFSEIACFELV